MTLKLFYDLMSQPCRALLIFLRKAEIPHQPVLIDLAKGKNREPEFTAINPLQKVPVIQDGDFILKESVAIFRYLAATRQIADHWYPADLHKRSRVDEYMAWQHFNTRLFAAMTFRTQFIDSFLMGQPLDTKRLKEFQAGLEQTLTALETVYFHDQRPFLLGQEISIADLLGVCELMQPYSVGQDVRENRPVIRAWMDRVKAETQPHFDDVHKIVYKAKDLFLASKI